MLDYLFGHLFLPCVCFHVVRPGSSWKDQHHRIFLKSTKYKFRHYDIPLKDRWHCQCYQFSKIWLIIKTLSSPKWFIYSLCICDTSRIPEQREVCIAWPWPWSWHSGSGAHNRLTEPELAGTRGQTRWHRTSSWSSLECIASLFVNLITSWSHYLTHNYSSPDIINIMHHVWTKNSDI